MQHPQRDILGCEPGQAISQGFGQIPVLARFGLRPCSAQRRQPHTSVRLQRLQRICCRQGSIAVAQRRPQTQRVHPPMDIVLPLTGPQLQRPPCRAKGTVCVQGLDLCKIFVREGLHSRQRPGVLEVVLKVHEDAEP